MFVDLLKSRRSIRKYKEEKLDDSLIKEIVEAALYAPSAMGRDNWEFLVLSKDEDIKKAALAKTDSDSFISTASHIVLVITDKEESKETYPEDGAICGILMQLRATELGIGSCWVQLRDRTKASGVTSEEYLMENFNIPKGKCVVLMMTFGYANEEKPEKKAKSFEEKVYFNRYGEK